MKISCSIVLTLLFAQAVAAQEWTQWRGPARNGAVSADKVPAVWPEKLRSVWRVEVGEGYSSPVVSDGRVFIHSRQDPEEIVQAIDLKDGKVLWKQKYTSEFKKNQYAVDMAKGPNATPLVAGKRLFTLGVTGILIAWDTSSGREVWRKDFSTSIDTAKLFCGTAASPLLVDGQLIVQVGSDIHGGRILSLDPATGKSRWEWTGPGPGYASPIAISAEGTTQIVALTQESIIGLDSSTGKQLWNIAFPDEWHENITTPIWTGAILIVSGTRQGTHAYKFRLTDGKWQASEIWKNTEVAMYMSSPVYADGLVYSHSSKRKGQFVALEAETGIVKWATEGREGEHASLLLTPQHIILLTNSADLIIVRRGPEKFTVERRYEVAESSTFATPVLLGSTILVRDTTGLSLLTKA